MELDGHVVSPFDINPTLQAGGGLLVLYSLSGSPVIKQLMQMVTMGAWPGWVVSISVLPLTKPGAAGGLACCSPGRLSN